MPAAALIPTPYLINVHAISFRKFYSVLATVTRSLVSIYEDAICYATMLTIIHAYILDVILNLVNC